MIFEKKAEDIEAYKKYHKTVNWSKSFWLTIYREGVIVGLDKGLEVGRKKGREEGKIQLIKNAFEMKLSLSQIAKLVEIPEQEVVEILNQNALYDGKELNRNQIETKERGSGSNQINCLSSNRPKKIKPVFGLNFF